MADREKDDADERNLCEEIVASSRRRVLQPDWSDELESEVDEDAEIGYFPPGLASPRDPTRFDFALRAYDLPLTLSRHFDGTAFAKPKTFTTSQQINEMIEQVMASYEAQADRPDAPSEPETLAKAELFERCGEYPFLKFYIRFIKVLTSCHVTFYQI